MTVTHELFEFLRTVVRCSQTGGDVTSCFKCNKQRGTTREFCIGHILSRMCAREKWNHLKCQELITYPKPAKKSIVSTRKLCWSIYNLPPFIKTFINNNVLSTEFMHLRFNYNSEKNVNCTTDEWIWPSPLLHISIGVNTRLFVNLIGLCVSNGPFYTDRNSLSYIYNSRVVTWLRRRSKVSTAFKKNIES